MTESEWINIRQAYEAAGVTRRTIYNWIYAGHLVTKRTAGGSRRILRSSLWKVDTRDVE